MEQLFNEPNFTAEEDAEIENEIHTKKYNEYPRSRRIFLTYPQTDSITKETLLQYLQQDPLLKAAIICREKHNETQGYHLHAVAHYSDAKYLNPAKFKFFKHGNIQKQRGTDQQAENYIMKDNDYIKYNWKTQSEKTNEKKAKLKEEKKKYNEMIIKNLCTDLVDQGEIHINSYYNLERNKTLYNLKKQKLIDQEECKGIWIYGKSGAGKSWAARHNYGNYFLKGMNKWWDGYENQPTIVLEDFQISHGESMGYLLKIWADCYGFSGEVKGMTVPLNYKTFIVTSQYLPNQIWTDKETRDAIYRRFTIVEMENQKITKTVIRYAPSPTTPLN